MRDNKDDTVTYMDSFGNKHTVKKGTKIMIGSGRHAYITRAGIPYTKEEVTRKEESLFSSKTLAFAKRLTRKFKKSPQ